jgi:acid phosphatase class B
VEDFTSANVNSYSFSSARTKATVDNVKVLDSIVNSLKNSVGDKKKCLVIFDIDSTLLDTSYRTGGIFKEFARHPVHKEAYPKLCQAIEGWEEMVEVYDPIEFVNHHSGFDLDRDSDTSKYLLSFWKKRFFNPDWLCHDMPYRGAQNFVQRCIDLGSDIAYLTGRESKSLLNATLKSLAVHRFPLDSSSPRTRIMLKDHSSIKDLLYKDEGISSLKSGYDHVIFIDNELELVAMSVDKHPDVTTYLFDSVHSGRVSNYEGNIPKITNWNF